MSAPRQRRQAAAFALLWLSLLLAACQGAPRPSVFEQLIEAEGLLTASAQTLEDGLRLGTITARDPEFIAARDALAHAGEVLDGAWSAYRAGDLSLADSRRRLAVDVYLTLRPMLARLAGGI